MALAEKLCTKGWYTTSQVVALTGRPRACIGIWTRAMGLPVKRRRHKYMSAAHGKMMVRRWVEFSPAMLKILLYRSLALDWKVMVQQHHLTVPPLSLSLGSRGRPDRFSANTALTPSRWDSIPLTDYVTWQSGRVRRGETDRLVRKKRSKRKWPR